MARFARLDVYNAVVETGLIPLFYHPDTHVAQRTAAALAAGGCRLLEFTNRGDFALEVFRDLVRAVASEHPQMIVGVGSVEDAATAALFIAHGADFIVSPLFNPEVARLCNRRKIGYIPGCATVNEIAAAEEHGAEIVKLFPGETTGGPDFVKAVRAPRPWTSILPTGGVSPDEENLRAWFGAGVVAVGMGSKLVRKEWLQAGDYQAITRTARETLARIRAIRQEKA